MGIERYWTHFDFRSHSFAASVRQRGGKHRPGDEKFAENFLERRQSEAMFMKERMTI